MTSLICFLLNGGLQGTHRVSSAMPATSKAQKGFLSVFLVSQGKKLPSNKHTHTHVAGFPLLSLTSHFPALQKTETPPPGGLDTKPARLLASGPAPSERPPSGRAAAPLQPRERSERKVLELGVGALGKRGGWTKIGPLKRKQRKAI